MNDPNSFALNHIIEESIIFNELEKMIENFFGTYQVPEWLTRSQSRMISEILLSGNKDTIMVRLNEYKERQLKRTSQKGKWWQKEVDKKMAIDAFCEIVNELPNADITSIIENEIEDLTLTFDLEPYNKLIHQTLIRKFDYLFIMKYSIMKKETDNV